MSSSTISIDAPLDEVAATLFAIADYPQWSGAFKKVDVLESDDQGRATRATLSVDAGDGGEHNDAEPPLTFSSPSSLSIAYSHKY